jgi:hypothetical protein
MKVEREKAGEKVRVEREKVGKKVKRKRRNNGTYKIIYTFTPNN